MTTYNDLVSDRQLERERDRHAGQYEISTDEVRELLEAIGSDMTSMRFESQSTPVDIYYEDDEVIVDVHDGFEILQTYCEMFGRYLSDEMKDILLNVHESIATERVGGELAWDVHPIVVIKPDAYQDDSEPQPSVRAETRRLHDALEETPLEITTYYGTESWVPLARRDRDADDDGPDVVIEWATDEETYTVSAVEPFDEGNGWNFLESETVETRAEAVETATRLGAEHTQD